MSGHIQIVDDLLLGRMILRAKLAAACHVSSVAGTGRVALNMAQQDLPGLIVLDSQLPDMDGVELCRQFRALPQTAHVPIIMLSASPTPELAVQALKAGADDFICKPVDEDYLLSRIRALLRHNAAEQVLSGLTPPMPAQALPTADIICGAPGRVALVSVAGNTSGHGFAQAGYLPRELYDERLGLADLLSATEFTHAADVLLLAPDILERFGPHVIADLRARPATSHLPLVATLRADAGIAAASLLDLGAEDVLHLPINIEEAKLRLAAMAHRKHRQDAMRAAIGAELDRATRDPLTGLYNRRHAMSQLAQLINNQNAPDGEGFAILLLDMDNFKNVNDSFGHIAGDDVLVEAARRMRDAIGPRDHLARFGGEEFLLLLPGADIAAARVMAERLRNRIEGAPFMLAMQGAALRVTASIGVAEYHASCTERNDTMLERIRRLVDSADQAMRLSKSRGRNCVSVKDSAVA